MKRKMRTRLVSAVLAAGMTALLLAGCGARGENEEADTISVYLWSVKLYDTYAPYIQSKLPDVNIECYYSQSICRHDK